MYTCIINRDGILKRAYASIVYTALTPERIPYEWAYKCYSPPARNDRT